MRKYMLFMIAILIASPAVASEDDKLKAKAEELSKAYIIVDTHIDVPYRLWKKREDISVSTEGGDFDYPRARAGGLDGVFMSIFTPWKNEPAGTSKALADSLIDLVEGFAVAWPEKFAVATTVSEVEDQFASGLISLIMGMENGSPIEGDLRNVAYFYDRGVRYITLTHSKDNHICDSSYDDKRTWKGLSPFGRQVVAKMNDLGVMIDVSHISDDSFYQVMELTKAPVIASHSSCRSFTPGWERNMGDEMIKQLAKNGGVLQINFGSVFLNDECKRRFYEGKNVAERWAMANGFDPEGDESREYRKKYFEEHPVGFADITDVADHVDHVVELVGVDHVGFGSDYDGVGDSLPTGLKDVSTYPNLIYELLKRGYSDQDIKKICSGNLFRVWREVERVAAELSSAK